MDVVNATYLGEAYWRAGRLAEAAETLRGVTKRAGDFGMPFYAGTAHRLLGEVTGAADEFEQSIAVLSEIGAENELALAYAGYSRLLTEAGHEEEGRRYLTLALRFSIASSHRPSPTKSARTSPGSASATRIWKADRPRVIRPGHVSEHLLARSIAVGYRQRGSVMHRSFRLLFIPMVAVLALGGCGKDDKGDEGAKPPKSAQGSVPKSGEAEVSITNFEFKPQKVVVKPGTKVTWKNEDVSIHDIKDTSPLATPQSSAMSKGDTFSITYAQPGPTATSAASTST